MSPINYLSVLVYELYDGHETLGDVAGQTCIHDSLCKLRSVLGNVTQG